MRLHVINMFPTTIVSTGGIKTHESLLRSYQILEKVKYYLENGVPANIIMELINEMEYDDTG